MAATGCAGALFAGLALTTLSFSPAQAQWIEAGPYRSTNTAPSSPGNLNSNTLVIGMSGQGDPVYGAANMIVQSPVDANTYWLATVSGGIWKTSNGGVTWTPTTDHLGSLSIGAIAVDTGDPTGKTLYAGTGDYSAGFYHYTPTTTLLKSIDGGNTWQPVASTGIQNLFLSSGGQQLTDSSPASIKSIIAMGNVILVAAGGSTATTGFFNSAVFTAAPMAARRFRSCRHSAPRFPA